MKKVEVLKSLGEETRLRVLNLFLTSGQSLCVCEIVDALRIPQYTVSKHLTTLRHAGLVEVEKEGLWGYYRLSEPDTTNKPLFEFLKMFLSTEQYASDQRNLEARLLLRQEGKCVVGFVSEAELLKLINEKTAATP
jgi:ArsR family transcriptional regulator